MVLSSARAKVLFLMLMTSLISCVAFSGCMTAYKKSVGANTQRNFSKVFISDYDLAWQSTLEAMKSIRLDVTNREGGFLQTRWMDNTKEKNFSDGDGSTVPYMKAQYRFKVSVGKGVYQGRTAIKVTVQREQLASRDALDDFRPLDSDTIEENTLLYRIGRIISLKTRLAKLEALRTKQEIQQATREDSPALPSSEDPGVDTSAPPAGDAGGASTGSDFIPEAPPEALD